MGLRKQLGKFLQRMWLLGIIHSFPFSSSNPQQPSLCIRHKEPAPSLHSYRCRAPTVWQGSELGIERRVRQTPSSRIEKAACRWPGKNHKVSDEGFLTQPGVLGKLYGGTDALSFKGEESTTGREVERVLHTELMTQKGTSPKMSHSNHKSGSCIFSFS